MAKRSYNEKLNDSKNMPCVEILDDPRAVERYGGEKMLLAPPLAYDTLMKSVPKGRLITADTLRGCLAKKHNADFTCPLTAGIFINIVAGASRERDGADETPYWRTLKKNGELNEKYPDGIDGHKMLLEEEGHVVVQKGKRWFVQDYECRLYELEP